jgi:hypothetical protein
MDIRVLHSILRYLAVVKQVTFTVGPLKMSPKGRKMYGHISNWIISNKLVYTGWLMIPRCLRYAVPSRYEFRIHVSRLIREITVASFKTIKVRPLIISFLQWVIFCVYLLRDIHCCLNKVL